jgi:hypothetical protein
MADWWCSSEPSTLCPGLHRAFAGRRGGCNYGRRQGYDLCHFSEALEPCCCALVVDSRPGRSVVLSRVDQVLGLLGHKVSAAHFRDRVTVLLDHAALQQHCLNLLYLSGPKADSSGRWPR